MHNQFQGTQHQRDFKCNRKSIKVCKQIHSFQGFQPNGLDRSINTKNNKRICDGRSCLCQFGVWMQWRENVFELGADIFTFSNLVPTNSLFTSKNSKKWLFYWKIHKICRFSDFLIICWHQVWKNEDVGTKFKYVLTPLEVKMKA